MNKNAVDPMIASLAILLWTASSVPEGMEDTGWIGITQADAMGLASEANYDMEDLNAAVTYFGGETIFSPEGVAHFGFQKTVTLIHRETEEV